jgi:hypothetical protein
MRRQLLSVPVAIITFAVALLLTPNDPTAGVRGIINSVLSAVWSDSGYSSQCSKLSDYYGYWGGSGGNVIALDENYITDVEQGRTYQYRIVSHVNNRHENAYVLQVIGLDAGSNLRNYIYLGFSDDGWMGYYGYNSLDDYYQRHFTAGGSFSKYPTE